MKVGPYEYPFGTDVDTLIVCVNQWHRERTVEALQLKARYILQHQQLTGHWYQKIIVFHPHFRSIQEEEKFKRWIAEHLPTRLKPEGRIYLL